MFFSFGKVTSFGPEGFFDLAAGEPDAREIDVESIERFNFVYVFLLSNARKARRLSKIGGKWFLACLSG